MDRVKSSMQQVPNAIPKVIRRTGGANSLELEKENFERGQVGSDTRFNGKRGIDASGWDINSEDDCRARMFLLSAHLSHTLIFFLRIPVICPTPGLVYGLSQCVFP